MAYQALQNITFFLALFPRFSLNTSNLFEKATILNDYGSMGMGDVEYRWILAVRNLLIGVFGISNHGGPLLVGGNYKVYRFDKTQKTTDLDIEKIEPLLFK